MKKNKNSIAEHTIQTIKEMAITMLTQANLPEIFWTEMIACAIYL